MLRTMPAGARCVTVGLAPAAERTHVTRFLAATRAQTFCTQSLARRRAQPGHHTSDGGIGASLPTPTGVPKRFAIPRARALILGAKRLGRVWRRRKRRRFAGPGRSDRTARPQAPRNVGQASAEIARRLRLRAQSESLSRFGRTRSANPPARGRRGQRNGPLSALSRADPTWRAQPTARSGAPVGVPNIAGLWGQIRGSG